MDRLRGVAVAAILGYQRWLAPALPPACRFYPTCSTYAVEAIQRHGPLRGLWMAACRLSRCHSYHSGGLDPVP